MSLIEVVRKTMDQNRRLIATDRYLRIFMVGAFVLLFTIITYCALWGNFGRAETYFLWADEMISGTLSYAELDADVSPLTLLLLIPPRLVSPTAEIYCYVFSLYGFAFYMLGGHYILKSCRETGYSQKEAYGLLFVTFLCAFSFMTLSTGSFAPSFIIISLWFYHKRNFTISFVCLALATMIAFWPVFLFIVYLIVILNGNDSQYGDREIYAAKWGLLAYVIVCVVLFCIPFDGFSDGPYNYAPNQINGEAYLGGLLSLLNLPSPPLSLALGFALVITFVGSVSIRKTDHGMRYPALMLEFALILILIFYPGHTGREFIWIAMLLPMTQMCEKPTMYRNRIYISFGIFAFLSVLCDSVISTDSVLFNGVSVLRLIGLAAMGILVFADLNKSCINGKDDVPAV